MDEDVRDLSMFWNMSNLRYASGLKTIRTHERSVAINTKPSTCVRIFWVRSTVGPDPKERPNSKIHEDQIRFSQVRYSKRQICLCNNWPQMTFLLRCWGHSSLEWRGAGLDRSRIHDSVKLRYSPSRCGKRMVYYECRWSKYVAGNRLTARRSQKGWREAADYRCYGANRSTVQSQRNKVWFVSFYIVVNTIPCCPQGQLQPLLE